MGLVLLFFMWISNFPSTIYLKDFFLLCVILRTFVENQVAVGAWIYLWVLFSVLLVCVCISMPVLCCFDYFSFVVYFEVRQYKASCFVPFYWRLLWPIGAFYNAFFFFFCILFNFLHQCFIVLMDIRWKSLVNLLIAIFL
jgi:hypothetical protein